MALELLMEISQDPNERALFLSRRKAETDRTSNLLTAEARGEARGRAEGRAEGEARGEARAVDRVLSLIDRGFSPAEIRKQLGR